MEIFDKFTANFEYFKRLKKKKIIHFFEWYPTSVYKTPIMRLFCYPPLISVQTLIRLWSFGLGLTKYVVCGWSLNFRIQSLHSSLLTISATRFRHLTCFFLNSQLKLSYLCQENLWILNRLCPKLGLAQ